MVQYVHVSAGVVDRDPGPLPQYWDRGVVVAPVAEPPINEVKSRGWLPVTRTSDPVDPQTQKLGPVEVSVGVDDVVYHRPAVLLTESEVRANAIVSAQNAVRNVDLRVELLKVELLVGIADSVDPTIRTNLSQKSKDTITFIQNNASKI